ncbi:Inhibitor of the KinA pathway to sporulation, predicted exonuclease [Eubacterium ruminantium]|nr:Inhibitor of the KinA pathway to sporulation, predicted exonuclease [Eubacterium ruminantium]
MGKYVVIDLEMCTVPRSNKALYSYKTEIIQIGAAILDEEYKVTDKFNCYVKPEFGLITKFIQNLTGIKPSDVSNAVLLKEALTEFLAWIPKGDVTMVSWSTNDKYQLVHELSAKKLQIEGMDALYENWYDCQPLFSEKMKMKKTYNLEEALIATDIVTEGRAHDGLTDAYNTALLFAKMKTEPELKLNPYYKAAHDDAKPEELRYSLADLLADFKFDE